MLDQATAHDLLESTKLYLEAISRRPEHDQELLVEGMFAAAEFHGIQRRKSGSLYVIHPIHVAHFLLEVEMDTPTVIAGLLHDVLEDTVTNRDILIERFGEEVTQLVEGVTHHRSVSESEWQDQLYASGQKDVRISCLKIADRIANLLPGSQSVLRPEKHLEHLEETEHFYLQRLATLPGIPERLILELRNILEQSTTEYHNRPHS